MTIVVRPWRHARTALCTCRAHAASSADVASSSTRTGASRSSARANATRCIWPPLSAVPRWPSGVSRPSGSTSSRSSRRTAQIAWRTPTPAWVSAIPARTFSNSVCSRMSGSCVTPTTWLRNQPTSSSRTSTASRATTPDCGVCRRSSTLATVDLPLPDRPTTNVCSPAAKYILTPRSAGASGRAGYVIQTLSSVISPLQCLGMRTAGGTDAPRCSVDVDDACTGASLTVSVGVRGSGGACSASLSVRDVASVAMFAAAFLPRSMKLRRIRIDCNWPIVTRLARKVASTTSGPAWSLRTK